MTWHILKFSGSRCHVSHSPINIWCCTTILKFHELVSSVHRFYPPWKYWNFLFFFLFQRAAVRAKSHHGFTTEPMFQLDLTRFTGEVLFVVCINIVFINPLVLPENVLFFSFSVFLFIFFFLFIAMHKTIYTTFVTVLYYFTIHNKRHLQFNKTNSHSLTYTHYEQVYIAKSHLVHKLAKKEYLSLTYSKLFNYF